MNPVLGLIVANIIWGFAAPIFKFALLNIPPFTLAFLRFFIASIIFIPFIPFKELLSISKSDWVRIIVASFTGITLNISFFFLGLQKADSITAPIIASSSPIFLYILAIFFLHEKPKIKVTLGMLLSFIGVLIIVVSPLFLDGGFSKVSSEIEGNVFYIIATGASVVMPLVLKDVFKRISPYTVVFITFLIGSLTFLPIMIFELQTWSFAQINISGLTGIIFGAVFSSAIAYYLYYYGLGKIMASEIGIFTYIDPVVAVIIAIPLLHEYPDIFFFMGAILIFGGIFISEGRLHYHPFHKLKNYK